MWQGSGLKFSNGCLPHRCHVGFRIWRGFFWKCRFLAYESSPERGAKNRGIFVEAQVSEDGKEEDRRETQQKTRPETRKGTKDIWRHTEGGTRHMVGYKRYMAKWMKMANHDKGQNDGKTRPYTRHTSLLVGRKNNWLPTNRRTDGPTDGPTDGRTDPPLEMRGRI